MEIKNDYTARELADLKLPCLLVSYRQVVRRADAKSWPYNERPGRGGMIKHYLFSGLPEDVQADIKRHISLARVAKESGDGYRAGVEAGLALLTREIESQKCLRKAKEAGLAAFECLSDSRQEEAKAKYELLKARDTYIKINGLPVKKGSQKFVNDYIAGYVNPPEWICLAAGWRNGSRSLSWSSLNNWQKRYNEFGLAGLASAYRRRKGETSVPEHMQLYIKGLKYRRPTAKFNWITKAVEAHFDGETIPHPSSIRRYVKAWEEEHKNLIMYISDPDEFKSKKMFAMGNASEHITRLNQVWEVDSTPADLLLDGKRHCMIGIIDVYSRRYMLLIAPTSKAVAVAALLRKAILAWGVPEVLKTDNGQDYISKHMERVLAGLEITQDRCTPFHGDEKAHVERSFRTILHGIVEFLPGFIGHNVAERRKIEARRSFADRLMKKGGDPVESNLEPAEFQTICDRWVNAMYNHDQHGGLDGKTPIQMVREWREPIRTIEDERILDMLLAEAPRDGGCRTIGKKGIRVNKAYYIAPEFAGNESERVKVLLDATDYGRVFVYKDNGEFMEFLCLAYNGAREGIVPVEIAARTKAIQRKIYNAGRKELKKISREQGAEQAYEEIISHRERQIANVIEMPMASVPYSTKGIVEAGKAADAKFKADLDDQEQEMIKVNEEVATRMIKENKAAKVLQLPKKETPVYITTDTERYQLLYEVLELHHRQLTAEEYAFLDMFYQSSNGRIYMNMQGDLRETIGLEVEDIKSGAGR